MPPAALISSTASFAPLSICCPSAADAPLNGCSEPILMVSPGAVPPPGASSVAPAGAEPPHATRPMPSTHAAAAIQVFRILRLVPVDGTSLAEDCGTDRRVGQHERR
jgi:hypothetical protein